MVVELKRSSSSDGLFEIRKSLSWKRKGKKTSTLNETPEQREVRFSQCLSRSPSLCILPKRAFKKDGCSCSWCVLAFQEPTARQECSALKHTRLL